MDYGALQYVECVGDDLNIKGVASFQKQLKLKRGETAVFSWIAWKRMMMGGFKTIIDK